MGLREMFDDGEAQPRALASMGIGTIEPFEDVRQICRCYPFAVILHTEPAQPSLCSRRS